MIRGPKKERLARGLVRSLASFGVLAVLACNASAADLEVGKNAYEAGDYQTALAEFLPLAEQGNADAQYNLGLMYNNGIGVPQDYAEAMRLYRIAAKQGQANAQYGLGLLYEVGKGVTANNIEAHMWLNIAGANGIEASREKRDEIELQMTSQEVSAAQRHARACMASGYIECDTNTGVYAGEFRDGKRNGKGKLTYANGSVYEGVFKDGKLNGEGRAVYSDGSVYVGRFEANQMTGQGRMTTPDGLVFEGMWKAGLLDGQGRAVYPNGDVYEGNFVAGERQGQGRMVFAGGQEFEGQWEDGEPVLVESVSVPLTHTEKDWLRLAIIPCWSAPAGVREAKDLRITVGVQLDPGGGIVDGTIRLLDPAVLPDSRYEAAFRAARIALLRCAPYRGLPSDKYGLWRDPQITFGPEGLLWW
jgi:hypothetical protein